MKKLIAVVAAVAVLASVLCACAQSAKPLGDVFEQIKKDYSVTDMVEFKGADDLNRYGIDAADVKECAGGINKSGVNQEEIVMVLAADPDAADRILTALDKRRTSKLNETKNYNPEQYAIIEKCSAEKDGKNYVSLFISEKADSMRADYKKAIGA